MSERQDYRDLWAAFAAATPEQKEAWRIAGQHAWIKREGGSVTIAGWDWRYCANCQSWLPTADHAGEGVYPHVC